MGLSVIATCECGYSSGNIFIGYGMIHRDTVDYHPCLCRQCHEIIKGNMKQLPILCPQCGEEAVPYARQQNPFGVWVLCQDQQHECPVCGKQTLTFGMGWYLWD
jgi:RNA polymerase subunit RPABC4/transcription elongation factor Spt4